MVHMKVVLVLLAAVVSLRGEPFPKHNLTFGAGAGLPRGQLTGLFSDSAGVSVGYGYRFQRYFQADVGLDVLFGAAGVRAFLPSEFGYLRIRDYQFLIPFGGRVILPLKRGRFQISGGGGGVHMHYSERVRQPSNFFRIDCPVCNSRGGWGYYALLGTSMALDSAQHFRFGVTSKVYRGHTSGDELGSVPGITTRDHWINLFGDFTFSF
jgi:hypothetical protein